MGRDNIGAQPGPVGLPFLPVQGDEAAPPTDHFAHLRHILPVGLHKRIDQHNSMRHFHVSQRDLTGRRHHR